MIELLTFTRKKKSESRKKEVKGKVNQNRNHCNTSFAKAKMQGKTEFDSSQVMQLRKRIEKVDAESIKETFFFLSFSLP